jgi:hypothetical protein
MGLRPSEEHGAPHLAHSATAAMSGACLLAGLSLSKNHLKREAVNTRSPDARLNYGPLPMVFVSRGGMRWPIPILIRQLSL